MFSFSFRRILRRGVFALSVLLCLSAALLASCNMGEDDDFVDDHLLNSKLIGTWEDTQNSDSYTITENHLTYQYGSTINYAGTIEYVSNFTDTAGVIIIKYDADHKPTYYDSNDNYGKPEHIVPLKGEYVGVYFKELDLGVSVKIGGAYVAGGAEEATLENAKKAFTLDNEGTYMTWYGTYTSKNK